MSSCCFLSQALTIGVVARNQTEMSQTGVTIVFACDSGDDASVAISDSSMNTERTSATTLVRNL